MRGGGGGGGGREGGRGMKGGREREVREYTSYNYVSKTKLIQYSERRGCKGKKRGRDGGGSEIERTEGGENLQCCQGLEVAHLKWHTANRGWVRRETHTK